MSHILFSGWPSEPYRGGTTMLRIILLHCTHPVDIRHQPPTNRDIMSIIHQLLSGCLCCRSNQLENQITRHLSPTGYQWTAAQIGLSDMCWDCFSWLWEPLKVILCTILNLSNVFVGMKSILWSHWCLCFWVLDNFALGLSLFCFLIGEHAELLQKGVQVEENFIVMVVFWFVMAKT